MKGRDLVSNNKGVALTIFILILLVPLCIMMVILNAEVSQAINVSDQVLQEAVTLAVKGSAMMVCSDSQAVGDLKIVHSKAHEEFLRLLNLNLGLTSDGKRARYTGVVPPLYYWLIVYNGDISQDEGFLLQGAQENEVKPIAVYTNKVRGAESYLETSDSALVNTFGITDDGFEEYAEDAIAKVTLDGPGVVAIVQTNIDPVFKNDGKVVTRWALAKLIQKGEELD